MTDAELNRAVAEAMGWEYIEPDWEPPLFWISPDRAGRIPVLPDWAGNWSDCGPLIEEANLRILRGMVAYDTGPRPIDWDVVTYIAGDDAELRRAICRAYVESRR